MTEPTHQYRPDVVAQLDYLMDVTNQQTSRMLEEEARESMRSALANAWTAGFVAASLPRQADEDVAVCPYDDRRPAVPAAEVAGAAVDESGAIS